MPEPSPAKNKWHDHDPYKLPPAPAPRLNLATAPDPRLATEEELRSFIDSLLPEDFDINSPLFKDLPTEAQYELIGDLRLKSRQTSYARLESMLASAPTALDFSRAQIVNLKQRNNLTQKLLATVENVGKVRYTTIPTRIASERNRVYVLVKNDDDKQGGWILGVRDVDEGKTKARAIDVERESDEEVLASDVLNMGPVSSKPKTEVDSDEDEDDMEEILPSR